MYILAVIENPPPSQEKEGGSEQVSLIIQGRKAMNRELPGEGKRSILFSSRLLYKSNSSTANEFPRLLILLSQLSSHFVTSSLVPP